MKKTLIIILPLLLLSGCATKEEIKERVQQRSLQGSEVVEKNNVMGEESSEPKLEAQTTGDIQKDMEEIDSLLKEDEADDNDLEKISDKELGI